MCLILLTLLINMVHSFNYIANRDAAYPRYLTWLISKPRGRYTGTAPYCDSEPGDCPNVEKHLVYTSGYASEDGGGNDCLTGDKSYCSDELIWEEIKWYGTSPGCEGSCSDCPDGWQCIVDTNDSCWSGAKFICAKPVFWMKYIGCYHDNFPAIIYGADRAMVHGPHVGGFTANQCRWECIDYKYFGLGPGGYCTCTNEYGDATEYGSADCDAFLANELFINYYSGCYADSSLRDLLRFGPRSAGYNGPESCRNACMSYKYYALQDSDAGDAGQWCSCENDFNRIQTTYGVSTGCNGMQGGPLAAAVFENFLYSGSADFIDINHDKDNKVINKINKNNDYLIFVVIGLIFCLFINILFCISIWNKYCVTNQQKAIFKFDN